MILRKHTLLTTTLLILSLTCAPVHAYSKRNVVRYMRDTVLLTTALLTAKLAHAAYIDPRNNNWGTAANAIAIGIASATTGFTGVKNMYNTYRNSKAQQLAADQNNAQDDTEGCSEMGPEDSQLLADKADNADNTNTTLDSGTRYRYE